MKNRNFEENGIRGTRNIKKRRCVMFYIFINKSVAVAVVVVTIILAGCAATQNRVSLEPGKQVTNAEIDLQTGVVKQDQDSVQVSVQGAMLPGPYNDNDLHPSFWVTIQNNRKTPISLKPAAARLIDSAGNQFSPVPMSVETKDRDEVDQYVMVDPEINLYFGLHYGWPFYPLYPYPAWRRHGYFFRGGFGWYDPFWDFGPRVAWVKKIVTEKGVGSQPEKVETIYNTARVTYLVVFPRLSGTVSDMRLMIPGVTIRKGQTTTSLDFELVFNQIKEIAQKSRED
jgi:hypothetical protein